MSKQLAISAAFSVFAMAAFVLSATPSGYDMNNAEMAASSTITGAKAQASAPAIGQALSALPLIGE